MADRSSTFAAFLGSICLLAVVSLHGQQTQPLTTVAAVHALSNQMAARSLPVRVEGSVTYYERGNIDLFVQDGETAIYVETTPDLELATGDRVLIEGVTRASFRPEIQANRVTFLHHGTPPLPVKADFTQMIRADLDCRRATVRAVVRAANVVADGPSRSVLLDLLMAGGPIQAQIADAGTTVDLLPLLDSTIEVTGAVAGKFDSKSQMIGILLEVPSFSDLRTVEPASRSPRQLTPRKFDEILDTLNIEDQTQRVRVEGTITYFQPGSAMVLQNGINALWVDTLSEQPHQVGDHVLVSGFPDVRNGSVVLTGAEIESTQSDVPLTAERVDPVRLASGAHAFSLVSVEGQLIMRVREAAQDQYVIASQGHVFSAFYRHPERGMNLPTDPMREFPLGSWVRVTGICVLDRGDQFRGPVAFHLLLRSSQDIAMLAGPSPVSVQNLGILLAVLVILVFVAIARAFLLERRLRWQDVATASAIDRWRTRVIDGINNAIPLRETLSQITELLALQLQAEYCWAEIELEGTFGNCPAASEKSNLEVIEHAIPARSGTVLGRICAGFRAHTAKRLAAPEAIENALRLAALAIETGGKYSDLVRRSEVDPLTNAANRFAFDRALDLAIEREKESGARFGLIYIDLDEFKQVNDQFGHHVGDCYLQETVSRLRNQCRSNDILARIGGDEFAVLVTSLNSAQELQDIALRLQNCFDEPFCVDLAVISASASIGCAVYPENATTRAGLLEYADARMYQAKRHKRHDTIRIPLQT